MRRHVILTFVRGKSSLYGGSQTLTFIFRRFKSEWEGAEYNKTTHREHLAPLRHLAMRKRTSSNLSKLQSSFYSPIRQCTEPLNWYIHGVEPLSVYSYLSNGPLSIRRRLIWPSLHLVSCGAWFVAPSFSCWPLGPEKSINRYNGTGTSGRAPKLTTSPWTKHGLFYPTYNEVNTHVYKINSRRFSLQSREAVHHNIKQRIRTDRRIFN